MAQLTEEADPSAAAAVQVEDDLVARLRAGDEAAFAQLVDEWSPVMLHVAGRYVANTQAAEDVVQEAWLGVIKGLPRFEGRSSLRSWAFSILINRAKTRRTRDFRLVPSATMTAPEQDGPVVDPGRFQGPDGRYPGHWGSDGAPRPWEEPETGALGREVGELIDRALDDLPERQRLVVQMRDVQGMSSDEACAALQLSPQNQRVLLHRGRSALRAVLEAYYVD